MGRALPPLLGAALGAAVLASIPCLLGGCPRSERRPDAAEDPTVVLRYRFEKGRQLRYESTTVERGRFDVTIAMLTRWTVDGVRPSGAGDLTVTVESYRHTVFPSRDLPPDVATLNRALRGARFRMRISDDGASVEHLGAEELPPVSEASIEALRATLSSHVLKLPGRPVTLGQRWSVEKGPGADAGPGALSSRSRWRVLSLRRQGSRRPVELVCLSTMDVGPMPVSDHGGLATSSTEFHYNYLFDAAAGVLEALTSAGSATTKTVGIPDAGSDEQSTTFEGKLRLLPRL